MSAVPTLGMCVEHLSGHLFRNDVNCHAPARSGIANIGDVPGPQSGFGLASLNRIRNIVQPLTMAVAEAQDISRSGAGLLVPVRPSFDHFLQSSSASRNSPECSTRRPSQG